MILGAHPSLTDGDLAPMVPAMLAPELSVLHLPMAHASAVTELECPRGQRSRVMGCSDSWFSTDSSDPLDPVGGLT